MTDMLEPIMGEIAKLWAALDRVPTIKLATVTQASPLRIRLDGDDEPLPYAPIGAGGWTVGDRVICAMQQRRVDILAAA